MPSDGIKIIGLLLVSVVGFIFAAIRHNTYFKLDSENYVGDKRERDLYKLNKKRNILAIVLLPFFIILFAYVLYRKFHG